MGPQCPCGRSPVGAACPVHGARLSSPERAAVFTVTRHVLDRAGELPVVEDGDTSVLHGTGLGSVLRAAGFDVSDDDTDRQWDLYWDLQYGLEAL